MIIDIHHHFPYKVPEQRLKWLSDLVESLAMRLGKAMDKRAYIEQAMRTWDDADGEGLIAWMDESGIDFTCLFPVDNLYQESEEIRNMNRMVGEIAEKHSGRVMALAGLDPRRPGAPDMLKQCFDEFGVKGLKYHPDNGFSPTSPESYRLLEIVQEKRGILMTHTGPLPPPARNRFAEPMQLSDLAVDLPDLRVIAAHMGMTDWRSWAGLAACQPNLYGDLAMWDVPAFANYELFCRELRDLLDYAGPSKVLFGTDGPVFESIIPAKKWIQRLKDLPEKAPKGIHFEKTEVEAILGENAASILGLKKME